MKKDTIILLLVGAALAALMWFVPGLAPSRMTPNCSVEQQEDTAAKAEGNSSVFTPTGEN